MRTKKGHGVQLDETVFKRVALGATTQTQNLSGQVLCGPMSQAEISALLCRDKNGGAKEQHSISSLSL